MATDWVPVVSAAIGASAAVLGGAVTAAVSGRAARRHARQEREALDISEKRAAYLTLFQSIDHARAISDGVAHLGAGAMPDNASEIRRDIVLHQAAARFYAEPETWRRLAPLIEVTNLRLNWAGLIALYRNSDPMLAQITQRLEELGAQDINGWQRYWDEAVNAARKELR